MKKSLLMAAWVGLISVMGLAAEPIAEDDPLGEPGLSAFRQPIGRWELVAAVSQDDREGKERLLKSEPGKGVVINGLEIDKKNPHLITKKEYGDVEVQFEFLIPAKSNAGAYLMRRYEIQILDSAGKKGLKYSMCGGIYQRWDGNRDPKGYEGIAPLVNAAKSAGEWQRLEIHFRAPRFDEKGKKVENARFVKVLLNGQLVQENQEVTGPTRGADFEDEVPRAPLKIQGDHGPVALRGIRIRPVKFK